MEPLRSSGEGKPMGTEDDCYYRQKFDHIMRLLESSNPSIRLCKKEIEEQFNKLTHTPDHPPYASMIQRAITELNEQEGSSEETISKFIQAEYEDLPIAHASQLTHHLWKLVAKGEIVCTSRNCYMLSFDNPDFHRQLKKELKHLTRCGQGRQNCRQHKVKGVQSQKEQRVELIQEHNQVNGKIFEGIDEQKQAEEQQIGSTAEQKDQGHAELLVEHNEVEELRFKVIREQVEADQENGANEEHDEMQERPNQPRKELNLHQSQVLVQRIEVLIEGKNQAEENNLAENNNGETEAECQKEHEEEVIEEQCHEEQKSEKLEKKNQIQDLENETRGEQIQLAEVQIEAMVEQINPQGQHFEVSEEEKRLQEQQMEVCCQIIDLSNMLVHFIKQKKEDKATMCSQNYVTSQNMDLSGSSHLTKEKFRELLKKTIKIQRKLIDIISSLNMEMSDDQNREPALGEQQELLEEHLQQINNSCKGQPQQEHQLEVCGRLKVSECQPKTTPTSDNVPADRLHLDQNTQNVLPSQQRQPEDEITTSEELFEKQNKQIKLRDQQEAPKPQPKSTAIPLDVPCYSPYEENENTKTVIQAEEDYQTTEEKIKFSREANISRPETEKSYLVAFIDEQLQNSGLCGPEKQPKSQLVTSSLNVLQEHQQQTTSSNEAKGSEYKQQPENLIDGSHIEPELTPMEHQSQTQQQMLRRQQKRKLHLSEKPSISELAADTSVAKQCDQSEQIQNQHQRRQLRPRILRPFECEPVVTSAEDDYDLSLALLKSEIKQKVKLSIPKRPREISQPIEQQRNLHGQQKRLKYQPTVTTVDSAISSQQQGNGKLQLRQLQLQSQGPSQSELVVQKTRKKLLSLQLQQHEQKQQKPQGRGRPQLKSDVHIAVGKMLDLDYHYHEQEQLRHRGCGKPPKQKRIADAAVEGSFFLDHQNHNEKQPPHRGQGRPPKPKLAAGMDASLPPQHQSKRKKNKIK